MNVGIKFVVKMNKLSSAGPEIHRQIGAMVKKACFDIEAAAKDNAPVDTGALKASIYTVVDGSDGSAAARAAALGANRAVTLINPETEVDEMTGTVVVGADYGAFVEYGTTRMGAQPFLTPAVEEVRPKLAAALSQIGRKI